MRRSHLLPLALLSSLALASACDDKNNNPNPPPPGGGDAGVVADAGPADSGEHPDAEPLPCTRDQECDSGEVCNIAMDPAECVPGKACQTDGDCERCYVLGGAGEEDCGHGFNLMSYCGTDRGNVCTRMLGPCESCGVDRECGTIHPIRGGAPNKCVDYDDGNKYCGRSSTAGCPQGFVTNMDGQCVAPDGCANRPVFCPEGAAGQACTGTDQICPGETCAGTNGARCSNNDTPGAVGVCVHFCSGPADCPQDLPVCNDTTGICIAGCTKDSCAGGKTCHADGFCGDPCPDNDDCVTRYDANYYCNQPAQPPPRIYKTYHDENSCQKNGCERPEDCASAGVVCDKDQAPPACVPGCYNDRDCFAGEQCKTPGAGGPQMSYSRAECRALPRHPDDGTIGVCCNPGCTNRNLQCGFNEFCCGETDSAYEDPASCGTITSTGTRKADPGQCFDIAPRPFSPFCVQCQANADCDSQWMFGFNVDPAINGGQPFQEQEWCQGVAMGLGMCSVTCNPSLPEGGNIGCPRLWNCTPYTPPCFSDADCSGLACIGANTGVMPPVPGQCQCGDGGVATSQCPSVYPNLDTVQNPRCIELGANGEMFCVASYHCAPPQLTMDAQGNANYPLACLQ